MQRGCREWTETHTARGLGIMLTSKGMCYHHHFNVKSCLICKTWQSQTKCSHFLSLGNSFQVSELDCSQPYVCPGGLGRWQWHQAFWHLLPLELTHNLTLITHHSVWSISFPRAAPRKGYSVLITGNMSWYLLVHAQLLFVKQINIKIHSFSELSLGIRLTWHKKDEFRAIVSLPSVSTLIENQTLTSRDAFSKKPSIAS